MIESSQKENTVSEDVLENSESQLKFPLKKSQRNSNNQILATLSMLSEWVYDQIPEEYGDE